MAVAAHIKDYYNTDANGWVSVNTAKLQYKDQAREVDAQLKSDARLEVLKSFSKAGLAVGAAIGLGGLSFLAFKVASLAIGILVFPLMIIPPLYGLVTLLAGLGVGGAVFYLTAQKYSTKFFNQAKEHWNYGQHLYSQAHAARLKVPSLDSAKA